MIGESSSPVTEVEPADPALPCTIITSRHEFFLSDFSSTLQSFYLNPLLNISAQFWDHSQDKKQTSNVNGKKSPSTPKMAQGRCNCGSIKVSIPEMPKQSIICYWCAKSYTSL
jgi:hypothetical protein